MSKDNKKTKAAGFISSAVFLVFIFGFFIANLITPDRSFSEQENKVLKSMPAFSFESLFSGSFTKEFETYISEQFVLRDRWISLKAETELLLGKGQNNGVFKTSSGRLLKSFNSPSDAEIAEAAAFVNALCENAPDTDVVFALIPGASEIYSSEMPKGAPNDSQKEYIDKTYSLINCTCADIYTPLYARADEYIFYNTDHHWTTLGAYYAYDALGQYLGYGAKPLASYSPELLSDGFLGTSHSSSGFTGLTKDSIFRYVSGDNLSIVRFNNGKEEEISMYDESYLSKKDKYSVFYGGNTPLLKIRSSAEGKKLLIIRDSYTDSLSPFLTESFSEIHILDLRYYRLSLKKYIEENGFDEILVIYSTVNFAEDTNLFLLAQ
ncbi:MAG: DHHW family protein [Oscillospiraceae bacterium]|nr:DHHW family protein [Oscillospiraceae bacterium]